MMDRACRRRCASRSSRRSSPPAKRGRASGWRSFGRSCATTAATWSSATRPAAAASSASSCRRCCREPKGGVMDARDPRDNERHAGPHRSEVSRARSRARPRRVAGAARCHHGRARARADRRRPHRDTARGDRCRDRGGPQRRLPHAAGQPRRALRGPRCRHRRLAGQLGGGLAGGRRGGRRGGGGDERARGQRLRAGSAAGAPRASREGDGVLPHQQRRRRGGGGPARRRRARAHPRLGRPPRQRDAGDLRRARRRPLYVGAPVSLLSRDGRGRGDRRRRGKGRHRQLSAARRSGRRRLRRRVPRSVSPGRARLRPGPDHRLGRLRRARAGPAGRNERHRARLRGHDLAGRRARRGDLRRQAGVAARGGLRPRRARAVGARVAGGANRAARRFSPRRRDRRGAGGGGGTRCAPGRRADRSQDVTMRAVRWPPWTFGSGASVGSLASRLLALIALAAWVSLGSQVRVLLGSRGLLPVGEFMDAVRADGRVSPLDLPTLLWRFHSDGVLVAGPVVGAALAVAALCGWRPRLCFALSTALYLSYATVGRDFLSFQWDNLLLECGFLAAFLPTDRPAPLVHLLFRLVLFKLYFESGVAKWQSELGDWQDGSAMTYYYETAPLPTWLAYTAHHLPVWWHHLESRATLVLELGVPFLIFGPRRTRLFAGFTFALFQICNAATANYGFFCYLAAALNVFLLDYADVDRAGARAARYLPTRIRGVVARLLSFEAPPSTTLTIVRGLGRAGAVLFVLVSLTDALYAFTEPGRLLAVAAPLFELNRRFRLVNSYHLFASITRERIEPELQTLAEGSDADDRWTPQDLWHKPGDPRRAPDFVAPHQPRVDFQLWFYGLAFRRREPTYVSTLVERMCEDPAAVQPLFRQALPPHPAAVRIVYWRYVFASQAERRATGAWWSRARVAVSRAITCAGAVQ